MNLRRRLAVAGILVLVGICTLAYTIPGPSVTQNKLIVTDSVRVNRTSEFIGNVNVSAGKLVVRDSFRVIGPMRTPSDMMLDAPAFKVQFNTAVSAAYIAAPNTNNVRISVSGTDYLSVATDGVHAVNGILFADTKAVVQDSIRITKGMYVGGQFINKILRASATLDFDLSAVTCQDLTITVTGATAGETVDLGVPNGSITTDVTFYAWVSATNTVTVRACDGALTGNPASGTFKVTVLQ